MDINQVYSGNSFKAEDLGDQEPTFIITAIEMKPFDKGNKLVLSFQGEKKTLVCNKTNAKRIAFMFGNDTNNWVGQSITLYTEHVDFQGEIVPAIRVKVIKQKPAVSAPLNRPPMRQTVDQLAQRQAPRRQTGGMSEDYHQDADDEIPF